MIVMSMYDSLQDFVEPNEEEQEYLDIFDDSHDQEYLNILDNSH